MNQDELIEKLGRKNYLYLIVFAYVVLPILWLFISIFVSYETFHEKKIFSILILAIGAIQFLILLRVFILYKNKIYPKN